MKLRVSDTTGSVVMVSSAETEASVLADAEPVSIAALPEVPAASTFVSAVLTAVPPEVVEPVPPVSAAPNAAPFDELLADEVESLDAVVPFTRVNEPSPLKVAYGESWSIEPLKKPLAVLPLTEADVSKTPPIVSVLMAA